MPSTTQTRFKCRKPRYVSHKCSHYAIIPRIIEPELQNTNTLYEDFEEHDLCAIDKNLYWLHYLKFYNVRPLRKKNHLIAYII